MQFYNTMSRKKETFTPVRKGLVGRPHGGSSVTRGSGSKRKEIRRLPYGAGVLGRPSVAAQSRFRTGSALILLSG